MTDVATARRSRLPFFDVLRGVALVAMTIYHFTWDLEFYGWLLPGTIQQFGWVFFARCIASSFLFLVGISLVLAHGDGVRWQPFWKRFAQVALAAAAITAATYVAFPQTFIFFGILHAIALFSILGLAFVRIGWPLTAACAAGILLIWLTVELEPFSHPLLWWTGLGPTIRQSNDYVPLFPWFAATLFGMAFVRLALSRGWLEAIGKIGTPPPIQRPLTFIGRHSLVYYLLHQPILLGILWVVAALFPPDRTEGFQHLCRQQCVQTRDAAFCRAYCGCIVGSLKREEVFEPYTRGEIEPSDTQVEAIIPQCVREAEADD